MKDALRDWQEDHKLWEECEISPVFPQRDQDTHYYKSVNGRDVPGHVGPPIDAIKREIESSGERILALRDDWDGEGSSSYSDLVVTRASDFVRRYATRAWMDSDVVIATPRILPGPDGSIDVHWKMDSYELLVNIPPDQDEVATFYGDDYGTAQFKGTFNPATYKRGLISWIVDRS